MAGWLLQHPTAPDLPSPLVSFFLAEKVGWGRGPGRPSGREGATGGGARLAAALTLGSDLRQRRLRLLPGLGQPSKKALPSPRLTPASRSCLGGEGEVEEEDPVVWKEKGRVRNQGTD